MTVTMTVNVTKNKVQCPSLSCIMHLQNELLSFEYVEFWPIFYPSLGNLTMNIVIPSRLREKRERNANSLDETILD